MTMRSNPTPTTRVCDTFAGLDAHAHISEGAWVVYLLECAGGRLYTGITNTLRARLQAHLSGRGARFTRAFPPVRLAAAGQCADRAEASRIEYQVKQLPSHLKLCAFPSTPN